MIIGVYILLFSLLVIIPLLYIIYHMITGKPLLINLFLLCLLNMTFLLWHPYFFYAYITQIRDYSFNTGLPLSYNISPVYVRLSVFLLFMVLFWFLYKDSYYVLNINTKKYTKAITEQALKNLGIPSESLEQSTKINTNAHLLFPAQGLFRWKFIYIDFHEIKDKALSKQIINEIKSIMVSYKEPNSRIIGFLLLLVLMLTVYKYIGLLLSLL